MSNTNDKHGMVAMLSPDLFHSSPQLPTLRLFGDFLYHGGLLFCDNNRTLVVYSEDWLAIWDLTTATQVAKIPGNNFRACIADETTGELIALTSDCIICIPLRRNTPSPFTPSRRVDLPESQSDDLDGHPLRMSLIGRTLVICTGHHLTCLNRHDLSMSWSCPLPQHLNRRPLSVRIVPGENPLVQIASTATRHLDVERLLVTVHDLQGQQTASILIRDPQSQAVRSASYSAVALLQNLSGESPISLLNVGAANWRILRLDGFQRDMHFFLSEGGEILAGAGRSSLAIWNAVGLQYQVACEDTCFDVRIPDMGQLALIIYSSPPDEGGLNMTGVIDVATGRVLGHCTDHLIGEPPHCFSSGNEYFATLITDSYCDLHPAQLPCGTVVVTKLPVS